MAGNTLGGARGVAFWDPDTGIEELAVMTLPVASRHPDELIEADVERAEHFDQNFSRSRPSFLFLF
jgi:hypothetical protein